MKALLDGVRVLDFGRYIAGPFCAEILAQFGADVIRIEKVAGSEDRYTSPVTADGEGAIFLQMNCNKRGMTLNPTGPGGREIIAKLVSTSDVVVANVPPSTLRQMCIDYGSLKLIKPDIIFTYISAFGSSGPYSDRLGFDGIGQAMSGAVYMGGTPGRPMKSFVPYVDYGTGLSAALGTLAALMARSQTGEGQQVEAGLLHTALCFNNANVIEQILLQKNRVGTGNRAQHIGPSDIFATKDGSVIVQVIGDSLFQRWVYLVGAEDWIGDPRFKDDRSRGDNGELISARAAEWCAQRTTEQALSELVRARIPAGPVLSAQEAFDNPHVQSMNVFTRVEYPRVPQPAPLAMVPVQLGGTPAKISRRPPLLGEHTDEILQEAGYALDEIRELRRLGTI